MANNGLAPVGFPADALVVCVGPPASGKSTFAAHFPGEVLAFDAFEGDGATRKRAMLDLSAQRLCRDARVVIDSTNLTATDRRLWCQIAECVNVPCVAVLFDVCWPGLERRNALRAHPIDRQVLRTCYFKFQAAKHDVLTEGFDRIVIERPHGHTPVPSGECCCLAVSLWEASEAAPSGAD